MSDSPVPWLRSPLAAREVVLDQRGTAVARVSGLSGPVPTETAYPAPGPRASDGVRRGEPAVLLGPTGTSTRARRSSIVVGRYLGTVVVTVHGELDLTRAGHLGNILADLIDGQGNLSIVVDLQDATATDADSLSVFTEAAERARRRGTTMRLNEPPVPLYEALELRGLAEFVGDLMDGHA